MILNEAFSKGEGETNLSTGAERSWAALQTFLILLNQASCACSKSGDMPDTANSIRESIQLLMHARCKSICFSCPLKMPDEWYSLFCLNGILLSRFGEVLWTGSDDLQPFYWKGRRMVDLSSIKVLTSSCDVFAWYHAIKLAHRFSCNVLMMAVLIRGSDARPSPSGVMHRGTQFVELDTWYFKEFISFM